MCGGVDTCSGDTTGRKDWEVALRKRQEGELTPRGPARGNDQGSSSEKSDRESILKKETNTLDPRDLLQLIKQNWNSAQMSMIPSNR